MQLLPHQQQCLDAIRTSEERTISFQMATGSGKTRVLLAAPASMNYTRIIYVFPTLGLIHQFKEVLKENMSETGDFSDIFCVLAALRATDPETYYQCIHFLERQKTRAHKQEQGFYPIEVPRDGNCFFSCIGLQTGETHRHVRQRVVDYMEDNPEMYEEFLSDEDDVDALREEGVWYTDAMDVVRAAADMLGQTIRIHHPDGRIDEVGEGEQLNVLLEDDHYTFLTDVARAERERAERSSNRSDRKKLFIDIDPEFKIMWKVSGDLNEDLEQAAVLKANEFKQFYEQHKRKPGRTPEESSISYWFGRMKQAKNKGVKSTGTKIYPDVDKILIDLLGKNWFENEDLEQTAVLKANDFKQFYETNNRTPTRSSTSKSESSLSYWFGKMKQTKKGKGTHILYPSVEKILVDLLGENWFENEKSGIKKDSRGNKPMTRTITPSTSSNPQPPHLSQLSLYHKEFKTLHSSNLAAKFKERPQLWSEYHQVAEANELSFPDGQVPYQRVIAFLQTHLATFHPKKHKTIVDMGCGTARVHRAFADRSNLTFHNLDHVACDDRVTVADISHTELEDGDADVVILCLALWGSNKEEYFKEAFRLLDPNGRLILIEPSKRWMDESGHRLRDTLLRHGFTIVQEDFMTGDQVNKFSLFVVKK